MADIDVINSLSSVFNSTANAIRNLSGKTSKIKPSSFADEINALNKVYYLGEGTSFDVSSLLPNIDKSKLTANNFIVEPVNMSVNSSGAYSFGDAWDNGSRSIGASGSSNLNKTYSNGVLTCSLSSSCSDTNVFENTSSAHREISTSGSASISNFRAFLIIGNIR